MHGRTYGDILMFYDLFNIFFFSTITDMHYVLETDYYTFPTYFVFWLKTLFK